MYGAEVSKELTPLWVFGPLIAALYVKLLKRIISLYVFAFNVVRNIPNYSKVAYDYVIGGKIKEDLRLRVVQPLVDIKNLDYKVVCKRKIEELKEEWNENYVDYVEFLWPYYCRTIRFLKRAKLI